MQGSFDALQRCTSVQVTTSGAKSGMLHGRHLAGSRGPYFLGPVLVQVPGGPTKPQQQPCKPRWERTSTL